MTDDFSTAAGISTYLRQNRNWGRWGADDTRGTANLIDANKVVSAARLVRTGRKVSLSRSFPTELGPHNRRPAQQYWTKMPTEFGGGVAGDWIGVYAHGATVTHLDGLAHMWDGDGLYNGRSPETIDFDGAKVAGIESWSDGFMTRGIFLDVPAHRSSGYVTQDDPVQADELDDILRAKEIDIEPGDAVCIYSGREAFQRDHPDRPYGAWKGANGRTEHPGLHASCLRFLREHDAGMLIWDMMDRLPDAHDLGLPATVHSAIFAFGLALIDNALLEPLAIVCAEERRWDFLLVAVPLLLRGGTGSPINPLAIF